MSEMYRVPEILDGQTELEVITAELSDLVGLGMIPLEVAIDAIAFLLEDPGQELITWQ